MVVILGDSDVAIILIPRMGLGIERRKILGARLPQAIKQKSANKSQCDCPMLRQQQTDCGQSAFLVTQLCSLLSR